MMDMPYSLMIMSKNIIFFFKLFKILYKLKKRIYRICNPWFLVDNIFKNEYPKYRGLNMKLCYVVKNILGKWQIKIGIMDSGIWGIIYEKYIMW
jgi:hypothetical protein